MKTDILAIGVHPDDIELGCAGTILSAISNNKIVAILDLTEGEMGSRGSVAARYSESAAAAALMGISERKNLQLKDCFFEINEESLKKVISIIRYFRPDIILCNAPEDRHPDHGRASELVEQAAFLSGLAKIQTSLNGENQPHWRPSYTFHYVQDRYIIPDFIMDISPFMEKKMEVIRCYVSQFYDEKSEEPSTYISDPLFLEKVRGRALDLGKSVGVTYGEGFVSKKKLCLTSFDNLVTIPT